MVRRGVAWRGVAWRGVAWRGAVWAWRGLAWRVSEYSVPCVRLVHNHVAVAKFAARGCGQPGYKRFQAPLADPYAVPHEKYVPEVDALLRRVVQTLVEGDALQQFRHGPPVLTDAASSRNSKDLALCLKYLRDRVGVPRDMGFHAALQLRAHLNEVICALGASA